MKRIDVWTPASLPNYPRIRSVAARSGAFVAVGDGIFTSADGVVWAARATPNTYYRPFGISDVAACDNGFIAVTVNSVQNDWFPLIVLRSVDQGVTWTSSLPLPVLDFGSQAVAAKGAVLVAAGKAMAVSKDNGQHWTAWTPAIQWPLFNDVVIGQDATGRMLIVGVGCVYLQGSGQSFRYSAASYDGVAWTDSVGSAGNYSSVAFNNGVFVATAENRRFYTSRDGLTWTGRAYQPSSDLFRISFGNGEFVAVGSNGAVYASPDWDHWTEHSIGAMETLVDVCYGNHRFLAASENGRVFLSERYDRPFLSVDLDGGGSVTATPPGVTQSKDFGLTFDANEVVTLEAHSGYTTIWKQGPDGRPIPIRSLLPSFFESWSGSVSSRTSRISVRMDADKSETAHFGPLRRPKIVREKEEPLVSVES